MIKKTFISSSPLFQYLFYAKMQASFATLSARNLKDMIVVWLATCAAILGADSVQGWGRFSKEEDLEMDRQLKLINKPAIKSFQVSFGCFRCIR